LAGYVTCNLILGIETVGWSLLLCGFAAAIPGSIAGEELADVVYDEATVDDDEIRAWLSSTDLGSIGRTPASEKIRLIFSLMKGWISGDDVDAMVKVCQSVTTQNEMDLIRRAVSPHITSMSSIGQRTRLRIALARKP
jgi:hypothetical protein